MLLWVYLLVPIALRLIGGTRTLSLSKADSSSSDARRHSFRLVIRRVDMRYGGANLFRFKCVLFVEVLGGVDVRVRPGAVQLSVAHVAHRCHVCSPWSLPRFVGLEPPIKQNFLFR